MSQYISEELDNAESERILALSDEEVMAEHLALYGGDKRLAAKSIDMLKATIQRLIAERRRH